MSFVTRSYNSIKISDDGLVIRKTSSDSKLSDEIDYYKSLPDSLKLYFARFVSGIKYDDYSVLELEYYAYSNLGELLISGHSEYGFWTGVFSFIKKYIESYKRFKVDASEEANDWMLIGKTIAENKKLGFDGDFYLNGRKLKSFDSIWPKIEERIRSFSDDFFYLNHGDLCFSNILAGQHPKTRDVVLKFIDPRGSYGNSKHGSVYYDLAKLYHSINGGYEYLINGLFEIEQYLNKFSLTLHRENNNSLLSLFEFKFRDYDMERIKLTEGLLYISMAYRHGDDPKRQMSMYLIGLDILNNYA